MVTKDVYRDLLTNKQIPAILDKWPRRDRMSRTIYIQQDGAKNHIHEDDEEFNNALTEQENDAKLYTQTLNSPDVNLLDLGFFQAIQSFNDASPKNEEELIQLVQDAYENYLRHKLNQTWLTLQSCFNQIILHHGDNDYSIEHISKASLEWQGQLLDILDVVDDDIYKPNDKSDGKSSFYNENEKATRQETPKLTEYPSYPHTSGRTGATANDSPHRNRNRFVAFCVDCWMCFFGCMSWRVCGGVFLFLSTLCT